MRSIFFFCLSCLALPATFAGRSGTERKAPASEVYATASDGTPLTWTVNTPTGIGPWPAVLVIHGGRFVGGDPEDAGVDGCAQDLANAGYVAFAIDYRLAPPGSLPGQKSLGRFPDQYDDVHLAVEAARNDARSNGQVGAVGGSAGATHAAWVAATGAPGGDRLDLAVCLSGAYDFSDFTPDPNLDLFVDAVTNYVGVPSTDIAALRAASPAWVLDSGIAPLLVVDTMGDLMPAAQLDAMVAQLNTAGVQNYDSERLPGGLHSFAYWPQVKKTALDFLAAGFSTPPPPTPTPTATPSATPKPSPTATPPGTPGALLNISTRGQAGSGANVLIGGFILGPDVGSKRVIVRAIGPSLANAGVAFPLGDPSLQLLNAAGQVLAANDNWMEGTQAEEIIAASLAPTDAREAALSATLGPGAYTAIVNGAEGNQNIALVEVFDLDSANPPKLLNISTRGLVDSGEGVMIGGTIIGGAEAETLVFRGLGPSFATGPSSIGNPLPDPTLVLIDSQGATLFANDNWQDSQGTEIAGAGLAPSDSREAALLVTLPPGNYTALLSDTDGATGIGLLEIYNIGDKTQLRP